MTPPGPPSPSTILDWATGASSQAPTLPLPGEVVDPAPAPEVLVHAVRTADPDLALLALVAGSHVLALAADGRLVAAARRAADLDVDTADLGRHLLAAAPTPAPDDPDQDDQRLALVRREVELAARALAREPDAEGPADAELTVVVTAHDVGPWITETLDSVLEQRDVRLDVLVVDDHSGDETPAEIEKARVRAREVGVALRVVRPRLRGGAHARNLGAALARAPYVAFCDGDDLVAPEAYRTLVDEAVRSGAPLTVGAYLKFRPAHTWCPSDRWAGYSRTATHADVTQVPDLLFHRACWNKVFATSWWHEQQLLYPEVPRSNDVVPMVRAYLAASPVAVTERRVYLYRERPGASSMSSMVGTETSLRSYLRQEAACADLVLAHGDDRLAHEYAHVVMQEDAWVQVGRYLRSTEELGAGAHPDVLDRCRDLVRRFGPEHLRHLPLAARIAFAASRSGADDLLAAAAHAGPQEPATTRAHGWARVLDHGYDEADPTFPPREDVWRYGVLPTLDDLLDDDEPDVEQVAGALTALLDVVVHEPDWPAWAEGLDVVVAEAVALQPAGAQAVLDHLVSVRRCAAALEVATQVGPGEVTLQGTVPAGARLEAMLAVTPRGTDPLDLGAGGEAWSVTARRGLVPQEPDGRGRARLVARVLDERSGRTVHVHLRHRLARPLPDERRGDDLVVHRDLGPANLVLLRRRRVASRLARRAARTVLRRS